MQSDNQSSEQTLFENHSFLADRLKALGFEKLFDGLILTQMRAGVEKFNFASQEDQHEKGKIVYDVHFGLGNPPEGKVGNYWYINNIATTFQIPGQALNMHDFRLYKQQGYDADQMLKMMMGRSMFKEFSYNGAMQQVWERIDFNARDEYNNTVIRSTYSSRFNLDMAVKALKLPNISTSDIATMKFQLQRGERAPVYITRNGNKEQVFAEAVPHHGLIELYDAQGEKVRLNNGRLQLVVPEVKPLSPATQQVMDAAEKNTQQLGQSNEQRQGRRRA